MNPTDLDQGEDGGEGVGGGTCDDTLEIDRAHFQSFGNGEVECGMGACSYDTLHVSLILEIEVDDLQ